MCFMTAAVCRRVTAKQCGARENEFASRFLSRGALRHSAASSSIDAHLACIWGRGLAPECPAIAALLHGVFAGNSKRWLLRELLFVEADEIHTLAMLRNPSGRVDDLGEYPVIHRFNGFADHGPRAPLVMGLEFLTFSRNSTGGRLALIIVTSWKNRFPWVTHLKPWAIPRLCRFETPAIEKAGMENLLPARHDPVCRPASSQ